MSVTKKKYRHSPTTELHSMLVIWYSVWTECSWQRINHCFFHQMVKILSCLRFIILEHINISLPLKFVRFCYLLLAVFICFQNGISKNSQKVNILVLLLWKTSIHNTAEQQVLMVVRWWGNFKSVISWIFLVKHSVVWSSGCKWS